MRAVRPTPIKVATTRPYAGGCHNHPVSWSLPAPAKPQMGSYRPPYHAASNFRVSS